MWMIVGRGRIVSVSECARKLIIVSEGGTTIKDSITMSKSTNAPLVHSIAS